MRGFILTLQALGWVFLALIVATHAHGETLQESRWKRATVPPHRLHEVDRITARILRDKSRYVAVAASTGVPWHVVAGIHNMEASGSFKLHLHEGSPLTGRTRWVPKGRPVSGKPPFSWEFSATDALIYDRMHEVRWASLDATLYACERYNGTGYLRFHPETPSPYLWAATSIERPGKYIADGKWSSTAVSKQTGIAAIWKRLVAQRQLTLPSPSP